MENYKISKLEKVMVAIGILIFVAGIATILGVFIAKIVENNRKWQADRETEIEINNLK